MKIRTAAIFVISITVIVLVAPQFSSALDVQACRITRIGVMNGTNAPVLVQLLDTRPGSPTWPNGVEGIARQFFLSPDLGNAGYATLLTAYTLGKTVWVRIADPGTGGSLITVVLIND